MPWVNQKWKETIVMNLEHFKDRQASVKIKCQKKVQMYQCKSQIQQILATKYTEIYPSLPKLPTVILALRFCLKVLKQY